MREEQSRQNEETAANRETPRGGTPHSTNETPTSRGVEQFEKELEETRAKAQSFLDLAQRTQADFVNYKRRIEQERSDFARNARADVIVKLLPVVDDFDLAIASRPKSIDNSDWAQGMLLIDRKLKSTLESLGVKPIEPVGKPFDPWQEEALLDEASEKYPADTVTRVLRTGYTMDGKVIRPAQVVVSSGPPEGPASPTNVQSSHDTNQR
ncbi:MAG TPA: nucleotide exchange factor GrpE [Chloroflexota bacterium]|nr:nucleotide exchange factor GrpE [Chloroflexota bacterium]